jgi:hypothetical protein
MKAILRNMLLAALVASLTISLRAQSVGEAGSSTSEQEESTGDTGTSKTDIQEPPGEPKGTNVTGEETEDTDSTTVNTEDVDTTDDNKRAVDESLESRSRIVLAASIQTSQTSPCS